MAEKDLGTTIVLCAIFSTVYFAAGARLMHIASVAAAMIVMGVGAIAIAPWRVQRILAFLDPYKYADDESYKVFLKASRSCFICRIRIRILFFRLSARNLG
jgi:cell division protein FtsW